MSTALKRGTSSLLLIVYVCAAFGLQAGHTHEYAVRTGDDAEFRSHDCGTNERHLPAGTDLECALCQRVLQFVPVTTSHHFVRVETAEFISPEIGTTPFQDSRAALFFRRGPPVLS